MWLLRCVAGSISTLLVLAVVQQCRYRKICKELNYFSRCYVAAKKKATALDHANKALLRTLFESRHGYELMVETGESQKKLLEQSDRLIDRAERRADRYREAWIALMKECELPEMVIAETLLSADQDI